MYNKKKSIVHFSIALQYVALAIVTQSVIYASLAVHYATLAIIDLLGH